MSTVHSYSLFPISDREIYILGKQQEARIWSIADLKSWQTDREDYRRRASPEQRELIDKVMSFFVPVDGVVNKGHMMRTVEHCDDQCEQFAMSMQFMIEAVHAETYGLSAQAILGNDKLMKLKIEAEKTPAILDKIAFMEKYMDSKKHSYQEYLLAFACAEGIFISDSFIYIFWFRSYGMFPGLVHANSMISEDEMIHQHIASKRYIKHGGLPKERAMEIIMEAMEIELRYIDWTLPKAILDLTPQDVKTYLKLVVDYQLTLINLPTMYNVKNPFTWDLDRSLYKKPNPYERESGQYSRFSVQEVLNIVDGILSDSGISNDHLKDPFSVVGL